MGYTKAMVHERRMRERLAAAEIREAQDEEGEMLVADLRELLEGGQLEHGFEIDFGDDKRALEQTLALVGVEEQVHAGGYFNFAQGIVANGVSQNFISSPRVAPLIETHGVLDGVERLQFADWQLDDHGVGSPQVTSSGVQLTSQLMLTNTREEQGGEARPTPGALFVLVGVTCQYRPELYDEYAYGADTLPEIYEQIHDHVAYPNQLGAFGEATLEYDLALPQKTYSLKLGREIARDRTFGVAVGVQRKGVYVYSGGRLRRDARRSGDMYDDEGDE